MKWFLGFFFASILTIAQSTDVTGYSIGWQGAIGIIVTASGQTLNSYDTWIGSTFLATSSTALPSVCSAYLTAAPTGTPSMRCEVFRMFNRQGQLQVTFSSGVVQTSSNYRHGLVAGNAIFFYPQSATGTLPSEIATNFRTTPYYVCSASLTETTFTVGTGKSGSDCTGAISTFTGGSGTFWIKHLIAYQASWVGTWAINSWNDTDSTGWTLYDAPSPGSVYAVAITNVHATDPTTNYVRVSRVDNILYNASSDASSWITTNAAQTAPTTVKGNSGGLYLKLTDGRVVGSGVETAPITKVYSGVSPLGSVVTLPANTNAVLRAVGVTLSSFGLGGGAITGEVYRETTGGTITLLGTSVYSACAASGVNMGNGSTVCVATFLVPPTTVLGGEKIRIRLTANSGDASNYYQWFTLGTRNTADALSTIPPVRNTACAASCTTGANWTDDDVNGTNGITMTFQKSGPFAACAGGASACAYSFQ